jgi:hypothetical protein
MDTASVIREFLDENSIAAARSVEIAYKYHAELETGCRLTGCELIMRSVGEDVFVRAELPISVMTKETRGVVKYLADLNKKRVEDGEVRTRVRALEELQRTLGECGAQSLVFLKHRCHSRPPRDLCPLCRLHHNFFVARPSSSIAQRPLVTVEPSASR